MAVCLVCLLASVHIYAQQRVELPLVAKNNGMLLVEVKVNDKPYLFLLDSAGLTAVNNKRFGLPVESVELIRVSTAYGEQPMTFGKVRVHKFSVGDHNWTDFLMRTRPFAPMEEATRSDLGGILGYDTLIKWNRWTVDYEEKKLILESRP